MKPIEKIETLFARDENFVVTDEIKRPVLATISKWVATEKVDGTSMRIGWFTEDKLGHPDVTSLGNAVVELERGLFGFVHGKSNNASIPAPLAARCQAALVRGADAARMVLDTHELTSFTLYGEGYGGKIQKGGAYRPDQDFILFDVRANGSYLNDEWVVAYSTIFGVDRVPILGVFTLPEMIDMAKAGFSSRIALTPDTPAEGLVARPLEPLYDARGRRLIIKLKTCDWAAAKPKPDRRS